MTGVSTACLYPMNTEQALKTLAELSIDTVEIFFNSFSEIEPAFVKNLKRIADHAGMKIAAIHPFTSSFESFMLFTPYGRRFEDMLELYKKYFQAAKILGANVLILHGDNDGGPLSDAEYFERFAALADAGRDYGVTTAQENVFKFRGAHPHFISKMRQHLGSNAKFVFDIKQALRSGYDPFDVLDAMGEDVVHIHLSDNLPQGTNGIDNTCLMPFKGNFNFERLADKLRSASFDGCYILEVYRRCFEHPEEINIVKNLAF